MSDTTPIKPVTLNTKTVFKTSAACDRVKIHNNSSFYLQVYFGADAPQAGTDPGWHVTIDPGDKPLVGIVGAQPNPFADRSYIQSTPYLGVITVLPILPAGAPITAGGIVSGGAFTHITSYYPGEFAESTAGDEAYVQAVKQARYIGLGGATERWVGSLNQAQATNNMNLINGAAYFTLTSARCPALFNWMATHDTGFVNVYFYGTVGYWLRAANVATAAAWHIDAVLRDPTDAFDIAVETLHYNAAGADVGAVMSREHIIDQPCRPCQVGLGLTTNRAPFFGPGLPEGTIFRLRVARDGTVANWNLSLTADCLIDMQNQTVLNDVPYVPVIYGAPSDAPYDPNGNPQTW